MIGKGESANAAEWLKLYGNLLYQYALARVGNSLEAEDLIQDTFLSALKGLDGFKGEASEKNWLYSILKNKIIDHYRKKATTRVFTPSFSLSDTDDLWFEAGGHWITQAQPANWNAGQTATEQKELQQIIERCKEVLKELQKQVFVLKYMEDQEPDFICKVLNITTTNYWVLLHRCRLQMRNCVEINWVKNGGV